MSNFFFKSLTQKAKSKTETDSKSILVIESSGLPSSLALICPELVGFYNQIYESAVVAMDRDVEVDAWAEPIFQGTITKIAAKKTETATTFQVTIEALSNEDHGKIFAYLGDVVDCELTAIQTSFLDGNTTITSSTGEVNEAN